MEKIRPGVWYYEIFIDGELVDVATDLCGLHMACDDYADKGALLIHKTYQSSEDYNALVAYCEKQKRR